MFSSTVTGCVTADLEVKYSEKETPYICFNLAVQKGYGANAHTIFLQCWIFGEDNADRILKAKVGKGSMIQISGDTDLVQYKQSHGEGKGQTVSVIKIKVWAWEYIPGVKHKEKDGLEVDERHSPISLDDFEIVNDDSLTV